MQEKLVKNTNC